MYRKELEKAAEYYVKNCGWEDVQDFEDETVVQQTIKDCFNSAISGDSSTYVKQFIDANETDFFKLFALEIMCEYGLNLFIAGDEGLEIVLEASTNGLADFPDLCFMYMDEFRVLDRVVTKDLCDTIMEYTKNNPNEIINLMSYAKDYLKIRDQEIADGKAGRRTDRQIASEYDFGF